MFDLEKVLFPGQESSPIYRFGKLVTWWFTLVGMVLVAFFGLERAVLLPQHVIDGVMQALVGVGVAAVMVWRKLRARSSDRK